MFVYIDMLVYYISMYYESLYNTRLDSPRALAEASKRLTRIYYIYKIIHEIHQN